MFTDHKIAAFDQPIAALPDTPQLAPAALKAYFDASPEQLRVALGALCDDAQVLDDKVEGIVAQTYGGTIHESMLDAPLASKLNAKADQAALDTERTARADADTALQTQVSAKCEVVFGTYLGNNAKPQPIALGFQPAAVLVQAAEGWNAQETYMTSTGFALPNAPSYDLQVTETGFAVSGKLSIALGKPFRYMAFKPLV